MYGTQFIDYFTYQLKVEHDLICALFSLMKLIQGPGA